MRAFFVIPARLERATHSLEGCCSIQLSYGTNTYLPVRLSAKQGANIRIFRKFP